MSRARKNRRKAMVEAAQRGKDRARCTYCGAAISRKVGQPGSPPKVLNGEPVYPFTQDHIIPQAKGGCHDRRNLAPACGPCNGSRGDMPLPAFIASLGDRTAITVEEAGRMESAARAICEAMNILNRR